ncbi:AAA family ATPase [Roseomonas terrae]|uniref:AAA family ATPase n=1 Tax=Neoroseomonas terrae TaxID=424799 RepID=A0ABS5EPT5_9PROT|nr:AAA family ATPase [Neoroseomonas terrae]
MSRPVLVPIAHAAGGALAARASGLQGERAATVLKAATGRRRGSSRLASAAGERQVAGSEGATLENERKQITVLFADISGSTQLISGLDPENAWAVIKPLIQSMVDAVGMYGGTVNQILGDGIMALFGAPASLEDHAFRACCAALRMHQVLGHVSSGADGGDTASAVVRIHVGIATGEVLVGTVGSDLNWTYSAVGEVIHLASRLMQTAEPGKTLCAAETIHLAGELVTATAVGEVALRGLPGAVAVYRLLGARSTRARFHARAMRSGLSPFLGRDAELALLQDRLARAGAGQGQVVALVGDAGIGKSRLIWELTHSPHVEGWRVLEAGGVFYGRDIPHHPIAELLRTLFDIGDLDDAGNTHRKVAEGLRLLGEPLWDAEAGILALLSLDPATRAWAELDPHRRRGAAREAFLRLVRRLSEDRPLLLVVEDLHWADDETRALLAGLPGLIAGSRLLLLADYRAEGADPGWPEDEANVTRLALAPLSAASTRRLVESVVGVPATVAALGEELAERTAGNPFFLEETVRALVEAKVLEGEPGAFHATGAHSELRVPASVHAVLAARIDRLAPLEKRMLQAASVIGNRFPLVLLRALLRDAPQEQVLNLLFRLEDAGLVHESDLYPEPHYAFAHALTREVAYDGMLRKRRCALHAETLQAIEQVHATRLSEQVETLAYHAGRGEVWDRLAVYGREAGQRASGRSAYREAIRHFEQTLLGLARLLPLREALAESVDVRFELRNAYFPLGEITADLRSMREAERLAAELKDRSRLAWVSAFVARDLSLLGQPEQALEASRRALALADEVGEPDLRVLTRSYIGQAHYARGDYAESAATMREVLTEIAGAEVQRAFGLPLPAQVAFRGWLIWALARLGEFDEAERCGDELRRVAATIGKPLGQAVALYSRGFALVHQGRFETAIPLLEQGLRLCSKWGFAAWFTNLASTLGHALGRVGRTEEGMDLIWQAIRQTRAVGIMVSHANEVAWLAEAHLVRGQFNEAARHAQDAVELARRYQERGNEANALRVLGEVALRTEDADLAAARAHFCAALEAASACGMKPMVVACKDGLERLRRRLGRDRVGGADSGRPERPPAAASEPVRTRPKRGPKG